MCVRQELPACELWAGFKRHWMKLWSSLTGSYTFMKDEFLASFCVLPWWADSSYYICSLIHSCVPWVEYFSYNSVQPLWSGLICLYTYIFSALVTIVAAAETKCYQCSSITNDDCPWEDYRHPNGHLVYCPYEGCYKSKTRIGSTETGEVDWFRFTFLRLTYHCHVSRKPAHHVNSFTISPTI